MADRFVILHHVQSNGEHWDLMLESGDVLLTWQLEREPVDLSCLPIAANRIDDHRKAYLEYEGPLSHDRGCVRRVDSGTVKSLTQRPDGYELELTHGRLAGLLMLEHKEDHWILRSAPAG